MEAHVAEIDGHVTDAQLVRASQILHARHHVITVADTAADVHVEDRREDGRGNEQQRDDRSEGNRDAFE